MIAQSIGFTLAGLNPAPGAGAPYCGAPYGEAGGCP